MSERFHGDFSPSQSKKRESPEKFKKWMGGAIELFCKEFSVEGKAELEAALKAEPDGKFVLAASHFSNLDAPAAVEALGDILDIQITAESVLFEGLAPQRGLFKAVGKDRFSPLAYEKDKGGKHGVFNPENFTNLAQKIEEGRTPWIAIHPFTKKAEMQDARVGAVYLAHKSGAKIIPAGLEYEGGSVSLEGAGELFKAFKGRKEGKGTYHVGTPIELLPLDVSIIETVMHKRSNAQPVSSEEKTEFLAVMKRLREDANTIASKIGSMLPPERRGPYQEIPEVELSESDIEFIDENKRYG